MHSESRRAAKLRAAEPAVIAAFAAIYLIWGSTFLAIRYAVEGIPPFLMIGLRSLGAGLILALWVGLREDARPTWRQWRAAAVGGVCFFVLGHGSLAWAEQRIPSGIAAVVLALIPVWVVLLDWWRPGGVRPRPRVLLGVLLGFIGLLVLVGPEVVARGVSADGVATIVLALSALAWAGGTVVSRSSGGGASPAATSAMQLVIGGSLLLVLATVGGEWAPLVDRPVDTRAVLALLYLIIFGSVLTFSAYIWLLRVRPAAQVATYAYVNPIVAVLLGWAVAGEALTTQTGLATAMIIAAVAIIISDQQRGIRPG